ncbi:MAG TPA: hypothetical protein V6D05_04550 [Stenomitos sp.]
MRSLTENEWYIYQLRCQDGSYYAAATRDLVRALVRHHQGQMTRTRSLLPVRLAYACVCSIQEGEFVLNRLIRRPFSQLRGLPSPLGPQDLGHVEREVMRQLAGS